MPYPPGKNMVHSLIIFSTLKLRITVDIPSLYLAPVFIFNLYYSCLGPLETTSNNFYNPRSRKFAIQNLSILCVQVVFFPPSIRCSAFVSTCDMHFVRFVLFTLSSFLEQFVRNSRYINKYFNNFCL